MSSARPAQVWALLFLASASLAGVVFIAADRADDANFALLYRVYSVAAPALVGALWWRRRPDSGIGTMLVVLGGIAAVIGWQSSSLPLPFVVGVAAEAAYTVVLVLLFLTFPTGQLQRRVDKIVVGSLLAVLAATTLPWLISGPVHGSNPAFDCQPDCPPNPVQLLTMSTGVRDLLGLVAFGLIALIGLAVVALFVGRVRSGPRPLRRAMTGLSVTSLVLFPVVAVFVVGLALFGPMNTEHGGLALGIVLAVLLFPIGFVVPLIQADLVAGSELQRLLAELARRPSPSRWRDDIARAVDDPDLRIAYWDDATGRYLESTGRELVMSDIADGRAWLEIGRNDERIAVVATDPQIALEPELREAIGVATVAAVVSGQLDGVKRELAVRAAEAAETERMRMARDVHAGPQQRLAALRVHVTMVGQSMKGHSDQRALLDDLGRGLDHTMRDLYDTIRTKAPALVTRQGLGAALRAARHDSPITVRILDRGLSRHSPRAELAVYYCCLEGMQNTIKHGGPDASLTIRLADEGEGIRFTIEDDGVGFDVKAVGQGSGLQNIVERVTSLGGDVAIRSEPGAGTQISGLVRDAAPVTTAAASTS
jgi:signal transduction histidine kinase